MNEKQKLGQRGEEIAEQYYTERGYVLIARNVRVKAGEIDRVFKKDGIYYFVEVKTRRSMAFGYPEEAITRKKAGRMWRCVAEYCALQGFIALSHCTVEVCSVLVQFGDPVITIYPLRSR